VFFFVCGTSSSSWTNQLSLQRYQKASPSFCLVSNLLGFGAIFTVISQYMFFSAKNNEFIINKVIQGGDQLSKLKILFCFSLFVPIFSNPIIKGQKRLISFIY